MQFAGSNPPYREDPTVRNFSPPPAPINNSQEGRFFDPSLRHSVRDTLACLVFTSLNECALSLVMTHCLRGPTH